MTRDPAAIWASLTPAAQEQLGVLAITLALRGHLPMPETPARESRGQLGRRLTPDELLKLEAMAKAGATATEIARILGCSWQAVVLRLRQAGIARTVRPNGLGAEQLRRIAELMAQGVPTPAIAREIGCHPSTISHRLRRNAIPGVAPASAEPEVEPAPPVPPTAPEIVPVTIARPEIARTEIAAPARPKPAPPRPAPPTSPRRAAACAPPPPPPRPQLQNQPAPPAPDLAEFKRREELALIERHLAEKGATLGEAKYVAPSDHVTVPDAAERLRKLELQDSYGSHWLKGRQVDKAAAKP